MSYQQPTNNPYGSNPPAGNDPYAQQPANPYGQPSADPYAQASATPYGQPSAVDPYAQPSADPYAQQQAGTGSYAAPAMGGYGQSAPATGYAEPSDPYAAPANAGYADPYAAPQAYGQPGYGMQLAPERPKMGFGQAIKAFFQNYVQFKGRANVSEFWPPLVLMFAIQSVLGIILGVAGLDKYGDPTGLGIVMVLMMMLISLAMFLPMLGLYIRRFHDQNKSGWFYCLTFIPYVGALIVLIMALVGKSDPAGARFDDPSGAQPKTGN